MAQFCVLLLDKLTNYDIKSINRQTLQSWEEVVLVFHYNRKLRSSRIQTYLLFLFGSLHTS